MRKERGHEVWGPPRDPPVSADVGALLKRTVRVSFFLGVTLETCSGAEKKYPV
jgi:hypothetical protein